MNTILNWRIVVVAVSGLFGVAGAAFGADQHAKRKREQGANRARLQEIDARLREIEKYRASNENEREYLTSKLGEKSDQVRILAAEIEMLREQAAELRGAV